MSTITTINASDTITSSRSTINTNFSNLNTDKLEAGSIAQVNTGTSTTVAVTPDALAGSNLGTARASLQVTSGSGAITTGDGKVYMRVPPELNGMNIISVGLATTSPSTSGVITASIERGRQSSAGSAHTWVDTLSTSITIDANEYDSKDGATAPVINSSNDDVATGDLLRVNIDTVGTAPTAVLIASISFQLP
jgi:hypothetical protein